MSASRSAALLPPNIEELLASLRRRIRAYVWLEGLVMAAIWLLAGFWISLLLDWSFEPPALFRLLVAAVVAGGAAWWVYRLIVRRLLSPLERRHLAMLLERRFPQFDERLITAVELADRFGDDTFSTALWNRTSHQAASAVAFVRLGQVFRTRPLAIKWAAALCLAAALAVFAWAFPAALRLWALRSVALTSEPWPRRTRLVVDGFEGGAIKVARGSDLDIVVLADLYMPLVPQQVEIRYRPEAGQRQQAVMTREGRADPEQERFQRFTHTFRGLLTPLVFDVAGGDASVDNLRIDVVDSPRLLETVIDCVFPPYTGRSRRTLAVSGTVPVPYGSTVTLRARSNKPLVAVDIDSATGSETLGRGRDSFRAFQHQLQPIASNQTLAITLHDVDGISSREPVRMALAAIADEPPQVAVQLQGISTAITPLARLPVSGRIVDDYGVDRIWFDYSLDAVRSGEQEARTAASTTDIALDEPFDVRDLALVPGQKLSLVVRASDRFDLGGPPHVGSGQAWALDVVTAEQLQTMLEAREITLRQRFETVVDDVAAMRTSLIDLGGPAEFTLASETAATKKNGTSTAAASEQMARRALNVERAMQNSQKDAEETRGVAQAFDDIRAELINNRIYTEELRIRIEDNIVRPLKRAVDQMYPELDLHLEQWHANMSDEAGAADHERLAVGQVDALATLMQQVLNHMVALEDYNEAVETLRSIIAAQEKLREATRRSQSESIRSLLED